MRLHTRVKTPDALHIAAAMVAGCDEFWTADKQLNAIVGHRLKVVDWIELGLP
ncbi:MAG: PIN domain nuclease [Gammaproteobacteria bacterium]|nr:PIN domain nuclease [Gammaproteobacteria bacterium]